MAYRYKTVKIAGKTKLLHRHLMEQQLGRPLAAGEHVHHKNGDRYDNRLENLEVLSCAEHMHEHKQKHPVESACQVCSAMFTPAPTKRGRAKTCSPQCANTLRSRTEKATKAGPPLARALIEANFAHEREIVRAA
jgi:hypothetical protein